MSSKSKQKSCAKKEARLLANSIKVCQPRAVDVSSHINQDCENPFGMFD